MAFKHLEIKLGLRIGLKAGFPLATFFARIVIFPLSASLFTAYHVSKSGADKEKVASREKLASGKPALTVDVGSELAR